MNLTEPIQKEEFMSAQIPANNNQVNPSANSSGPDKRYFPRWEVSNKIKYIVGSEMDFHECISRDLSCAGLSMLAKDSRLAPAQKVKLKVELSTKAAVEVQGRVVWNRPLRDGNLVGINFEDINAQAQEIILQHAFEVKKRDLVDHWFRGWEK